LQFFHKKNTHTQKQQQKKKKQKNKKTKQKQKQKQNRKEKEYRTDLLSLNFGPDILVEYLPVIILFYKHFT
jgi:sortase (surface protein transpeptidase)